MTPNLTKPAEAMTGIMESIGDFQSRIDSMLSKRDYIIKKIIPLLVEGVDVFQLPGMTKKGLGKPGAEKLCRLFNITAKFSIDRDTMDVIGKEINGHLYVAFLCQLQSGDQFVGEGRGASIVTSMRNAYETIYEDRYKRLSDVERAKCKGPYMGEGKKSGNPYTYYRKPTDPVFDELCINTAIKMAEKSAYIDATIRATGMSDLFTQDVEDMTEVPEDMSIKAAPIQQPKPGPIQAIPQPKPQGQPKEDPANQPQCPKCQQGYLRLKQSHRGPFYGCTTYPKCKELLEVDQFNAQFKR